MRMSIENLVDKYSRTYLSIIISYENDMKYGKLLRKLQIFTKRYYLYQKQKNKLEIVSYRKYYENM